MPRCEAVERGVGDAKFDWHRFFYGLDRVYKVADAVRLRPLRKLAVKRAERWVLDRLAGSDGLGAIFPPMVWAVVGLKCLGYAETSPEVAGQLAELDRLKLTDENDAGRPVTRLQPCKSPVWDTAIAAIALRESGLPPHHPTVRKAADWLLDREIRTPGDASLRDPKLEPSGWCFEYRNRFYPGHRRHLHGADGLGPLPAGRQRHGLDGGLRTGRGRPHGDRRPGRGPAAGGPGRGRGGPADGGDPAGRELADRPAEPRRRLGGRSTATTPASCTAGSRSRTTTR